MLDALGRESLIRMNLYLEGIEKYRSSPYQRKNHDYPILEQQGSTCLIDYAPDQQDGRPVLVVPSLVNRAYILDLKEDASFMRWLADKDYHPYLVDWDFPGEEEKGFSLEDYINRLSEFCSLIHNLHNRRIGLVGYCMGGLLALATAQANPQILHGLSLLATPWDFQSDNGRQADMLSGMMPLIEQTIHTTGFLPTDILQAFFTGLDPLLGLRKFTKFALSPDESSYAQAFVALEDWLNDGVPLTGPAARECLQGWYLDNHPHKGKMADCRNPHPARIH